MRAARVLFAGVAALVLAVATAAWIAPGLLAGDRYRDTIAGLASSALGRPVKIDGPISLTVLPHPILTASAVNVADPGDGVSIAVGSAHCWLAAWKPARCSSGERRCVCHGRWRPAC